MTRRRILAFVAAAVIVATLGVAIAPRAFDLVEGGVRTASTAQVAAWRTMLSASPVHAALSPFPVAGTPDDVAELIEIRRRQATVEPGDPAAAVAGAWATEPVERWNLYLLEVIRKEKPNPVRASRALGLLNAALYDSAIAVSIAKNAAGRTAPAARDNAIRQAVAPEPTSSYPSTTAALAGAAAAVLSALFPARIEEIDRAAREALDAPLVAGVGTASDVAAGVAIGRAVGALAVERAATDGAGPPSGPGSPSIDFPDFQGAWRPQIAGIPPVEPRAGSWRPWLLASGGAVRPPAPPAPDSPDWQADAAELVELMDSLTPAQLEIARFWADGGGTDTPPGHWARIALELIRHERLTTPLAARVLAHLAIAQADAFIACWDAKYAYWTGRPFQLIPNFASAIVTPNFPSFPSGHATQSAAAAVVLGQFFPTEAQRLRAMAGEAAESRLFGGIHYRFDNEAGIAMGIRIGTLAVERLALDEGGAA